MIKETQHRSNTETLNFHTMQCNLCLLTFPDTNTHVHDHFELIKTFCIKSRTSPNSPQDTFQHTSCKNQTNPLPYSTASHVQIPRNYRTEVSSITPSTFLLNFVVVWDSVHEITRNTVMNLFESLHDVVEMNPVMGLEMHEI